MNVNPGENTLIKNTEQQVRRTLENILQENLAWAVKMLVFTVQAATP